MRVLRSRDPDGPVPPLRMERPRWCVRRRVRGPAQILGLRSRDDDVPGPRLQ